MIVNHLNYFITLKLFKNNIQHDKRVEKVAYKLDIDEYIVDEVLDIMYDYIRLKLESVELEDETKILTEEEFNDMFPTINIPSLGWISPSYAKYKHVMKNKLKKNGKNK